MANNNEPKLVHATAFDIGDLGLLTWDPDKKSDLCILSNNNLTAEWGFTKKTKKKDKYKPVWIPVQSKLRLHSGKFQLDFIIDELAKYQLGIGFMMLWNTGPDWGFFGYLGSSSTAFAYDPFTGDVVNNTKSIQGGLPNFKAKNRGIVTLSVNLPRTAKGSAKFIINNISTREIVLPEGTVIMPAACFLKAKQKVSLSNFEKELYQ